MSLTGMRSIEDLKRPLLNHRSFSNLKPCNFAGLFFWLEFNSHPLEGCAPHGERGGPHYHH